MICLFYIYRGLEFKDSCGAVAVQPTCDWRVAGSIFHHATTTVHTSHKAYQRKVAAFLLFTSANNSNLRDKFFKVILFFSYDIEENR